MNPALSLAGGAVRGWDRRNAYYFQLIQSLARHYRFDIEKPWNDLPEAVRHVLLWGSGEERVEFRYFDARGGSSRRSHAWEGMLPNLERRYRETESATVREELAKYRGHARLRGLRGQPAQPRGAQRVRRRPHAAGTRGAADRRLAPLLCGAQARRLARRGREPAGARGVGPPHVPRRCRARLPVAGPRRADAVGRRGAAHPPREPDRVGAGRRHVHPRRTVDRAAPARQPATAGHAHPAPRPRQHGPRRRARRGRDQAGRPRRRPRARRGGPRRPHRCAGHAGAGRGLRGVADRPVPERPSPHRRARRPHAAAAGPGAAHRRGQRQQPARGHGRRAARPDDLRDRRLRIRQVHAGRGHAVPPGGRRACRTVATAARRSRESTRSIA